MLFKKILGFIHLSKSYPSFALSVIYDNIRYCRYAIIGWSCYRLRLTHLEAQIIKLYHVIEKGLCMPDFRPRFGIVRVQHLIDLMKRFVDRGGEKSNRHFVSAVICLQAYREKHKDLNISVEDIILTQTIAEFSDIAKSATSTARGGVDEVSREILFSHAQSSFADFAMSRRSCRSFEANIKVSNKSLENAIKIALHTPSVCNRQAWKVHVFHDRKAIDKLLSYQNGNVGFGHTIPCLLIVTMDLQCFDGVIERYQPWIDGGMFGMTLLLAIHHIQLGAVPLNWSVLPDADKGLRKAARIPGCESIVMLIGVGIPVQEFCIPISQRRLISEVLINHE